MSEQRTQAAELRERIARSQNDQLRNDMVTLVGIELDKIKNQFINAESVDEIRKLQGEAAALKRVLTLLTARTV